MGLTGIQIFKLLVAVRAIAFHFQCKHCRAAGCSCERIANKCDHNGYTARGQGC